MDTTSPRTTPIMLLIFIIAIIAFGYEYYYSNSYDALTRRINKKRTELNLVALSQYIEGLNGTEVSWRGQIYSIERKGEQALISIDMNPEKGGVFPVPDITFTIDNKDAQLLARGEIATASGRISKISPCPFANSHFWELSDVKVR